MNTSRNRMGQLTWARFVRSVRNLATSEVGGKAKLLFALLVALLIASNGLNVLGSYVGRHFMTAIADRNMEEFIGEAFLYVGVFALCTLVGVFYRFTEERLGLLWRQWLTGRLVTFYLDERIYYHIDAGGLVANPDQRIAEDVRSYTVTTLSFALQLLNGLFTVVAFSGVLWSISPLLFLIAILYALIGSVSTIKLGKRLIKLNYDQLDKEANFRADLIHVQENAESVALLHREGYLQVRLLRHLDALVNNLLRMIRVNRDVGFFTTGYNYLMQVVPVVVVAPLYIHGEAEFGVITQAAVAFTTLMGAFSLIVTQFQSISSYAAVGARLSALGEAVEDLASDDLKHAVGASCGICLTPKSTRITEAARGVRVVEDGDRLEFQHLSLNSAQDGSVLIRDLSLTIAHGTRVLIRGPSDAAKVALFRALAGIWDAGRGVIMRPDLEQILFLPERPYLPPGSLREVLLGAGEKARVSDERILQTLRDLDAEAVVERAGGLDLEHDWDDMLSLSQQQQLSFARLLLADARFAVLDRPGTALDSSQVRAILKLLSERSVTYVTLGDGDDDAADYDLLLDFDLEGHARTTRRSTGSPAAQTGP